MRQQQITRVVDALRTQGRLIVQLKCGHNHSVWKVDFDARPWIMERLRDLAGKDTTGTSFSCAECPDEPPPTPQSLRQAKSAHSLWKEAGEP